MKILIAYDGSDCAKFALRDLTRAGLPPHVDALIVSAAEVLLPVVGNYRETGVPVMEYAYERVGELTQYALESAAAEAYEAELFIRAKFPKWAVSTRVKLLSPSTAILAAADEWKPDLIILGSHGRGVLGRFFMGSVSLKVLTEAHCPVRIVRGEEQNDESPIHIVVGYDGSRDAEFAIENLMLRVWPSSTFVHLVASLDLTLLGSVGYVAFATDQVLIDKKSQEENRLEDKLKMLASHLRPHFANVTTAIEIGSPKDVLLEEAEKWKANTILVGAKGMSRMERVLLGSVSHAVAARAKCSVEVHRRP